MALKLPKIYFFWQTASFFYDDTFQADESFEPNIARYKPVEKFPKSLLTLLHDPIIPVA